MRRSGFTLLELVLAAALSALILGATLQALLLVSRTQNAGRDAIIHSQLGRNLMRQFEWDLSHLVPLSVEETSSEDTELTDQLATINDQATDNVVKAEGEVLASLSEMVGTPDRLEMRIDAVMTESQWKRVFDATVTTSSTNTEVTGMTRRRRVVVWNPLGDGSGIVQVDAANSSLKILRQEMGVDSTETITGDVRLTAVPEVRSITFRYFDGIDWYEDWDSALMAAYPMSIEMTLEMGAEGVNADKTATIGAGKVLKRVFVVEMSRFVSEASSSSSTSTSSSTSSGSSDLESGSSGGSGL